MWNGQTSFAARAVHIHEDLEPPQRLKTLFHEWAHATMGHENRTGDSGRHIASYPEGHLMAPGERERYRSGIFYLYRDLNLPVTPVATSVGLLWNRRDWWKKPGRAAIEFLPAIETGLDRLAAASPHFSNFLSMLRAQRAANL